MTACIYHGARIVWEPPDKMAGTVRLSVAQFQSHLMHRSLVSTAHQVVITALDGARESHQPSSTASSRPVTSWSWAPRATVTSAVVSAVSLSPPEVASL